MSTDPHKHTQPSTDHHAHHDHSHDHGHGHHHDHDHAHGPNVYQHSVVAAVMNEALALLGDGVPAQSIEEASLALGMPTGVLAALDTLSLEVVDLALHAALDAQAHAHHDHQHEHGHGHEHGHEHGHASHSDHAHHHDHDEHRAHAHTCAPGCTHDHGHGAHAHTSDDHPHHHEDHHEQSRAHTPQTLPAPMTESAIYVMEKMAHGFKRMGKAAARGFYDYDFDTPQLWSGLKTFERRGKGLEGHEIGDRLMYAATLSALGSQSAHHPQAEAVLGAKIPTTAQQAEDWINAVGADQFKARCTDFSQRFGARFSVTHTGSQR